MRYSNPIPAADWELARDDVLVQIDGNADRLIRLAREAGHYPAIDVENSISRLMTKLSSDDEQVAALHFKRLWSRYAEQEDLINVGAYQAGSDPVTDEAIQRHLMQQQFLVQSPGQQVSLADAVDGLKALFAAPAGNLPARTPTQPDIQSAPQ